MQKINNMESEKQKWTDYLNSRLLEPTATDYKTFAKIKERKLVFDASGITDPENYSWGKPLNSKTNIYYPIEKYK